MKSRQIVGCSRYLVLEDSSVYSSFREIPFQMKPAKGKYYYTLRLKTDEGFMCTKYLHHIVLEAFVGPRPGSGKVWQACHNDGDYLNNHVTNLRWDTVKENAKDRIRHKTSGRGPSNGNAILNEELVELMRIEYRPDIKGVLLRRQNNLPTFLDMQEKHGYHFQTIRDAVTGSAWMKYEDKND